MGEEWAGEWGRWCAAMHAPEMPAQRYAAIPLEGWGPHTQPRPTTIRGGGPDHPSDTAAKEWLQAAPEPLAGWSGDVSSLIRVTVPPPHRHPHRQRVPSHGGTHMGTRRGHQPVAPPGGRSCPAHRGALQNWGTCVRRRPVPAGRHSGTLTPHAPHGPCNRAAPGAGQLRRAAGRVGGSRGWQPTGPPPPGRRRRVPVGHASAPPHRVPRVYGKPPPRLIAAFHDHGVLPDDTWQEVRRALPAPRLHLPAGAPGPPPPEVERPLAPPSRLLVAALPPFTHLPPLRGMQHGPRTRRRAPTGARSAPRWPRAPGANLPRARTGARKRRPCTGASGEHTPPHTSAQAPRAPPSCGSTCTCGTPRPSRTCRTCSRPNPHPPPCFAEPAAPCLADGGRGRGASEPAAERRRQPSGAW